MEWEQVQKKQRRGDNTEWDRRLRAASAAASSASPKKPRAPGACRRTEWFCSTHGCGCPNFMQGAACRKCNNQRTPTCAVVLGWEDMPRPAATAAAKGQPACPTHRSAAAPRSPGQRAPAAAATATVAKTPLQRARVTLELAVASDYPEAVLAEMRAHVEDLQRKERDAKPLGQRLDQARKRVREAQSRLERAEAAVQTAAKAKTDAEDECTAAQATLEACTSEAAEEGNNDSDSDREMLIAAALHAMLQVTESTWPIHAGGPPERLVAVMQAGHAALTRPRSATPPREAAAIPVEASAPTTPVQARLPLAGLLASMPDLRNPTTIQAAQDEHARCVREAEASGQTPPEAMRFILERVAQQMDQAVRAERIASPLASTHEDARHAPF